LQVDDRLSERLIEPEKLKTGVDWIRAGKRVFEEYDIPAFRTYGPKVIAAARDPKTFDTSVKPRPDGSVREMR